MNLFTEYTNMDSIDPDDEWIDTISECTATSDDYKSTLIDRLSDEDIEHMGSEMEREIESYMTTHILSMKHATFHDDLVKSVAAHFYQEWVVGFGILDDSEGPELMDWVRELANEYFEMGIVPRRQTLDPRLVCEPIGHSNESDVAPIYSSDELEEKLARIRSAPKIDQRSADWHAQRHQMLTASNAVKIFGTEAARNSLIYEKCQPYHVDAMHGLMHNNQPFNDSLAMNWGVKYEPVSIAVYEWLYGEHVSPFGCIQHPKYSFIGASPDGIVERTGRMVEVKNIFNRDINGVPKDAYWIQMQWQMETCDLDECDFVESRFKEFATAEEFYEKSEKMRTGEEEEKIMGVMVFLIPRIRITENESASASAHTSQYVIMPFNVSIDKDSIDEWLRDLCRLEYPHHVIHETYYWILDEWSCVLVQRNRPWFAAAIPIVVETWETIVRERETADYEHRAPKKRLRTNSHEIVVNKEQGDNHYIRNMPAFSNNVCLIKLDSGEYSQQPPPEEYPAPEVRTMQLF